VLFRPIPNCVRSSPAVGRLRQGASAVRAARIDCPSPHRGRMAGLWSKRDGSTGRNRGAARYRPKFATGRAGWSATSMRWDGRWPRIRQRSKTGFARWPAAWSCPTTWCKSCGLVARRSDRPESGAGGPLIHNGDRPCRVVIVGLQDMHTRGPSRYFLTVVRYRFVNNSNDAVKAFGWRDGQRKPPQSHASRRDERGIHSPVTRGAGGVRNPLGRRSFSVAGGNNGPDQNSERGAMARSAQRCD
jgi:hypothetical protein